MNVSEDPAVKALWDIYCEHVRTVIDSGDVYDELSEDEQIAISDRSVALADSLIALSVTREDAIGWVSSEDEDYQNRVYNDFSVAYQWRQG